MPATGRLASDDALAEAAILSTCNRTEIYCATDDRAAPEHAIAWLSAYHGVPADELAPHVYALPQLEAVRHAMRVASGLDSMALGETQILGQMKDAVRTATEVGAMGTYLNQMFQRTFSVAKEVRGQTDIGAHSVSMAAAAVRLAQRIFDKIANQRVLLIGAGEMIELCATHFAAQAPRALVVANRTPERGSRLAKRCGGQSIPLADLPERLHEFDIVVSCTASSLPIIGLGAVERAIKARKHRPIFMLDLAVPRDIEQEVGQLEDVFLFTVDDLGMIVREGGAMRQAAVAQAEAIIETRVQGFMQWLEQRSVVPVIRRLHSQADAAACRAGAREKTARAWRRSCRGARCTVAGAHQQVHPRSDPCAHACLWQRSGQGRRHVVWLLRPLRVVRASGALAAFLSRRARGRRLLTSPCKSSDVDDADRAIARVKAQQPCSKGPKRGSYSTELIVN